MKKRFPLFVVFLVLAAASFGYARYHYLQRNTVAIGIGSKTTRLTNPLADDKLFGNWVKQEWPFAIAIPSALLAVGFVLAAKK